MSATKKKNTGCKDCKFYEHDMTPNEWIGMSPVGYSNNKICHNKSLTKCNKKIIDPVEGERELELYITPENSNKTLTCKGFTPIDWKGKYESLKEVTEKKAEADKEVVKLTHRPKPSVTPVFTADIDAELDHGHMINFIIGLTMGVAVTLIAVFGTIALKGCS